MSRNHVLQRYHPPDLLEIAIIKGKQVLVLVIETLNVVGNTLGEVPDVTGLQHLSREASILINTSEKERSIVNKSPLSLFTIVSKSTNKSLGKVSSYHSVPVQLTGSPLLQMLLSTSDIMALWQILNDLLTGPTAREQSSLRLGKTPLDVGDKAIVGGRGAKLIWILEIHGFVRSTYCIIVGQYKETKYERGVISYLAEERLCHSHC